jgi:xanthine dehydrogenase molybdopterin-binding subunit B
VDTFKALAVPGVHSYVDHRDVPGTNVVGLFEADEEVFVKEKVNDEH